MDHRSRANTKAGRAALLAVIALALVGAGCAPSLAAHGRSRTLGTYNGLALSATVPMRFDVLTVAAAGEAALIERGYVISRKEGTQGRTTIVADTPAAGQRQLIERTVIFRAIQRNRNVKIEVSVRPMPNEAEPRAVLDATLARLGL